MVEMKCFWMSILCLLVLHLFALDSCFSRHDARAFFESSRGESSRGESSRGESSRGESPFHEGHNGIDREILERSEWRDISGEELHGWRNACCWPKKYAVKFVSDRTDVNFCEGFDCREGVAGGDWSSREVILIEEQLDAVKMVKRVDRYYPDTQYNSSTLLFIKDRKLHEFYFRQQNDEEDSGLGRAECKCYITTSYSSLDPPCAYGDWVLQNVKIGSSEKCNVVQYQYRRKEYVFLDVQQWVMSPNDDRHCIDNQTCGNSFTCLPISTKINFETLSIRKELQKEREYIHYVINYFDFGTELDYSKFEIPSYCPKVSECKEYP